MTDIAQPGIEIKEIQPGYAHYTVEPMEKLLIYNGSPRRSASNSALILEKAVEALGDKVEMRDLKGV